MKTIEFRYNYKFQNPNGWWLIFVALILYFSFLLASELVWGSYEKGWKILGLHPTRSFSDLKILLCGIEEYLKGLNPYMFTKCTYNYPLLWSIFAYIPYFDSLHANQVGIVLTILFFFGIFFFINRITVGHALIYCVILLSPSVMLGVERGNNDLIIFLLILFCLYLISNDYTYTSYFVLLFCSFLKFYPIVGFVYLLEYIKTKKRLYITSLSIILVFLLYMLSIQEQLKPIYQIHPRGYFLSYGIYTLPNLIYSKFSYFSLESLKVISFIVALSSLVYFILLSNSLKNLPEIAIYKTKPLFFNGYLLGSSIFVSSFMLGNNFDYRLVFLIFTIPQLLHWLEYTEFRKICSIQLLIIIFIFWNPFILRIAKFVFHIEFTFNLIEEISGWILFFIYLRFLALYLIQRYKKLDLNIAGI